MVFFPMHLKCHFFLSVARQLTSVDGFNTKAGIRLHALVWLTGGDLTTGVQEDPLFGVGVEEARTDVIIRVQVKSRCCYLVSI